MDFHSPLAWPPRHRIRAPATYGGQSALLLQDILESSQGSGDQARVPVEVRVAHVGSAAQREHRLTALAVSEYAKRDVDHVAIGLAHPMIEHAEVVARREQDGQPNAATGIDERASIDVYDVAQPR